MPDPTDNTAPATGFSKDYVDTLRQEAAGWRTKYQEEVHKNATLEVGNVLAQRGIKAEPHWVERAQGLTAEQAVDAFLVKHPHLATTEVGDFKEKDGTPGGKETATVTRKVGPKVPEAKTGGTPTGKADPAQAHPMESVRNLNEIKADPKARAAVAANYRELLAQGSNFGGNA